MGRKMDLERKQAVLQAVKENDGRLRAAGIAKLLGLHRQEVMRVLTSLEDEAEKYLCEDDKGNLSIHK